MKLKERFEGTDDHDTPSLSPKKTQRRQQSLKVIKDLIEEEEREIELK